ASPPTTASSSAATSALSARIAWRFVPVVNPDGLAASPPSRVNARGVDLNRNFPTPNWQQEAPRYWEQRTRRDPRRYPGRSPLSEPESRFIEEQLDAFLPDLIVSIHAPLGVLDFDGPAVPPHRLGRLYLDQVGVFPGSLGHYAGVHRRIPVVTIELPHALQPPTEAEMWHMWNDFLRWIDTRLLRRPDERAPPVQTASPMPSLPSPFQQLLPSPLQPILLPLKTR
ncbi:MAG: M14 family zinc carboxypeptidase, partial [Casimicrobiaceae bacterium]